MPQSPNRRTMLYTIWKWCWKEEIRNNNRSVNANYDLFLSYLVIFIFVFISSVSIPFRIILSQYHTSQHIVLIYTYEPYDLIWNFDKLLLPFSINTITSVKWFIFQPEKNRTIYSIPRMDLIIKNWTSDVQQRAMI